MKETGIIRKIDNLGRIVIPKEIRKILKIREGDTLEIYIENNEEIILRRYAPFGKIIDEARSLAEVLNKNTNLSVYITDNSRIIAVESKYKKNNIDRNISEDLLKVLEYRSVYINRGDVPIKITDKDNVKDYLSQVISPIILDGDILGAIILFSETTRKVISEIDLKILKMATDYMANQL